ncbi:MAG: hypothetical protein HOW97_24395 [Catenulispora sp.]|nr:hypothetical protein [Catenulispora sp.]
MTALLIDSGVDTRADLLGLLPEEVRDQITPRMLESPWTAASLRILATVSNTEWHAHVKNGYIDWQPIITWARDRKRCRFNSPRVALEMAASLGGYPHAHVNLRYAITVMPYHQFIAVMDALRITKQGVSK